MAALDTVEGALRLDRPAALRLLAAQPALLYETSIDTLSMRVEGLGSTFGLELPAARQLACEVGGLATTLVSDVTCNSRLVAWEAYRA
jgi:hypothetical protein